MSAPAPDPLDAEQLRVLQETRRLDKKLGLARGIALTNAVGMALFAVLSLLGGLFSFSLSPVALALGLLAVNEERGRRRLQALEPDAPNQLALNQLALFALVLVYCAWNAYSAWVGPAQLSALAEQLPGLSDSLEQQLGGNLDQLDSLARVTTLFVYGAVLAASFVVQGLLALYYRSLRPHVDALARAPEWAKALVE
jgi:hypothetical protein